MRFDFNDESVQDAGLKFPKLDLKKDEVARVCVISPYFDATLRHWVNRIGYVHCHAKVKSFQDMIDVEKDGGKPEECPMCKLALRSDTQDMVSLPKRHFATYALRYHTDGRGHLLPGQQVGYHLEIWLMGKKKYREISGLAHEWKDSGGLQSHDLEVACIEEKYQNFDITLKKEAIWQTLSKEIQKEVVLFVKQEIAKYPLADCLGDTVDEATLLRRFEVLKRRGYTDEQVNLGADDDQFSSSAALSVKEDPFGLGGEDKDIGGNVPPIVTEKEKKEAEKVTEGDPLDMLIP